MNNDRFLKQKQEALNKMFRRAEKKQRTCCYPDCNEKAINSHVLQKNGILNEISQNNHFIISELDFFKPMLFHFKRVGANNSFTFKGFCKKHDKEIFAPIEDFELDFDDYKSLLLFSYRTIMNEKVKKEVLIDWFKLQMESEILKDTLDASAINKIIEEQEKGIEDALYYSQPMEKDLFDDTESFKFKYRAIKSIPVCIASCFTYETCHERIKYIKKHNKDKAILTDIFISFFPIEDENILIMGYLKEQENQCGVFVESFFNCDEDQVLEKISDLMLCRCEMWACSEKFYYSKIKHREKEIVEILQESAMNINEDRKLDFNIFI